MKKFALLLFALPFILFTACDDDDDDDKPYFNPVEGEWVYSLPEYNSTETRIFKKNLTAFVIINNNGRIINDTLGVYTINETALQYKNTGNFHHYTIIEDTLLLEHKASNWSKKFIRKK